MNSTGLSAIPPRKPRDRNPFIVCLGRHGDIVNALPLAFKLTQNGTPIKWVVNREFAETLEGCSYVEPVIVDAGYSKPWAAASIAQALGMVGTPLICQAYGAITERQRKQKSYQIEAWEVAHYAHEFGYWPTIFDRRDKMREDTLLFRVGNGKPMVLVATSSVSSPIPHLTGLSERIQQLLPEFNVIDASLIKADRIYDMLGLMDQAELLITVDSALLHLSRASKCPVMAITNKGWFGSIPPPNTIARFDYGNAYLELIAQNAAEWLTERLSAKPTIFHAVDGFGSTDRHAAAKATNLTRNVVRVERNKYQRDARNIGEARALPFLKDIIGPALDQAKEGDIILWSNSDIALGEGIEEWAVKHAGTFGAATMRRDGGSHCGAELIAGTVKWFREHWEEIPDYIIAAPIFDLGLRAMVRNSYGIKSTMDNMGLDIFPAETNDRLCIHVQHEDSWNNDSPSARHNGFLFSSWLKTYGDSMTWRQ